MPSVEFEDFESYRALWTDRPGTRPAESSPQGVAAFREALLTWLGEAGMSLDGTDPSLCAEALAGREPVRLFVWLEDASRTALVQAVPEAALSEAQRAAFDALGSACFEANFMADLRPEQFAGALWSLAWFGLSAAEADVLDELREEAAEESPEVPDGDALRAALASGAPAQGSLDAPIVACHVLVLAM